YRQGFFKSTDCGDTWFRVDTIHSPPDVRSLAITPTTPQVIYAGGYNWGVATSRDEGITWRYGEGSGSDTVATFAIDPVNPSTVYAGYYILDVPDCCYGGGVRKSLDGGNTWSGSGLGQTSVTSLAVDPVNPLIL